MKKQKKIVFTEKQQEKLLEWAGYLETTELLQGQKSLRTKNDEYCCLGLYITCVHPEYTWKFLGVFDEDKSYRVRSGNTWQSNFLPEKFQRELGLHRHPYRDNIQTLQNCFVDLNDQLNYNFLEIAREIRHLVEYHSFTSETAERLDMYIF